MKFSFAAGEKRSPGFVHCDARDLPGIDLVHEWRTDNLLPIDDESVDLFLACDCIEHFCPADINVLLDDWHRVMRAEARLILTTPDMVTTARKLVEIMDNGPDVKDQVLGDRYWWQEEILRHVYGLQNHQFNPHKAGFTRETITNLLTDAGFTVDKIVDSWLHFGNMVVYARKY